MPAAPKPTASSRQPSRFRSEAAARPDLTALLRWPVWLRKGAFCRPGSIGRPCLGSGPEIAASELVRAGAGPIPSTSSETSRTSLGHVRVFDSEVGRWGRQRRDRCAKRRGARPEPAAKPRGFAGGPRACWPPAAAAARPPQARPLNEVELESRRAAPRAPRPAAASVCVNGDSTPSDPPI